MIDTFPAFCHLLFLFLLLFFFCVFFFFFSKSSFLKKNSGIPLEDQIACWARSDRNCLRVLSEYRIIKQRTKVGVDFGKMNYI